MKKIYLIFLLLSCLSFISFSIFNQKKITLLSKENSNNLKELIEDSINPHCSNNFKNSGRNSINYFKEITINIPESRKWSRNVYKAFIKDSGVIEEKYKKRFNAMIYLKNSKN